MNDGQGASSNKGDVSQQIMETHGSRVKKYGIYIDQMMDKLKVLQGYSQELFDTIGNQAALLIDI